MISEKIKKGVLQMTECKKYDIFYVDLGEPKGNIQSGVRPCIIYSNRVACDYSPILLVIPITSQIKRSLPTHLTLRGVLPKESTVLFEQVLTVNKSQLRERVGELPSKLKPRADEKLKISFGLVPEFA